MPDNEDDESWQLIQELRDKIESLKDDKETLQESLDEEKSNVREKEWEIESLEERIQELEEEVPLSKKFLEIFEYYHCIWSDDIKEEKLITELKNLHFNHRN